MHSPRIHRIILGAIAILLLLLLFSCTAGAGNGRRSDDAHETGDSTSTGTIQQLRRLILGRSDAGDSAKPVTEFFVDQALRAALDSVPSVEYVTLNVRDSIADAAVGAGRKGVDIADLGARLSLDGVVFVRVERFGSILAAEMKIVAPTGGRIMFRDVAWSVIRYRDTAETMYLGPALYDLVRKLVSRCFGLGSTAEVAVASEPVVITSVTIPRDARLDQVSVHRGAIATSGVKALGEYARRHFPELVAFDYAARDALYRTVNVAAVEDYVPAGNSERRAMFNLGIRRMIVASVSMFDADSVELRVEIRSVVSPTSDSLVDAEEGRFDLAQFQTSTTIDDVVIALIDLSQPLFAREAERIRREYDTKRARRGRTK